MNLSSELNQSCEELRLFGKQELSNNADLVLRYFALGYDVVLFPLSLSLTGLIIFLIIKFKDLQGTMFFLALQVAIIDSLFVLTFLLAAIISTIDGRWSIGFHMCIFNGAAFTITLHLRNWLMYVCVCLRSFLHRFLAFPIQQTQKESDIDTMFDSASIICNQYSATDYI